ncbi:MAG: hypothetical protein ACRC2S_07585 [Waterburya sp.]
MTIYTAIPYINDARLKLITARRVLSHTTGFPNWSGDAQTYKTFAIASRELGTGVVILTNSQNGLKVCPAIVSAVMSGDIHALDFEMIEY